MFSLLLLRLLLLASVSTASSAAGTNVTVCEGITGLIQCSADQGLLLDTVFMGRQDAVTCPHSSINSTNCTSDSALARLRTTCEGRMFCHLPVYFNQESDPCPGTYKYRKISYQCKECTNVQDDDVCTRKARENQCNTDRDWMMVNCFKACSRCDQSECEGPFEDLILCDYWSSEGECEKNRVFMVDNCPMACRSCDGPDVIPSTTTTTTQAPTTKAPEVVTVCEGITGLIQCEADQGLRLNTVFMGRQDAVTCPHSSINSTNCSSDTALARLRTTCEGRMFCHLPVYDNFGPDPCPGTYKYLQLSYQCQKCENVADDNNCTGRAAEDECNTNRDWMMDNCFKECTKCDQSECESAEKDLPMCDYWATRGECNSSSDSDWMSNNCPMACRSCDGPDVMPITTTTTTPAPTTMSPLSRECVNLEGDEECFKWRRSGECRRNPTYMWDRCHRACSRCECHNKHSNDAECNKWQGWGECNKNPDFMWDRCHKACSLCEGVKVTHKVWMNVTIGGEPAGVIVFGVFGEVVPKTAANFVALANHTYGFGYKNSLFHRVIKGFVIQGGDITQGNGYGGRSIYGGQFDDENFILKHYGEGWVNMANAGEDSNESQFAILTMRTSWLDNRHVVFAKIIEGYGTLKMVEATQTGSGDRPVKECKVVDAGAEEINYPYEVQKVDVIDDGEFCLNYHSDAGECSKRAQAGDCYSNDYGTMYWMWNQCYRSCSQCDTIFTAPTPPTTTTPAPTTTTPPRECKNDKEDDAICEGKAARGECEKNPDVMMDQCYKACADCNFNGSRSVLVCEGEELVLHCPGNMNIHIDKAFWGRADETTCPHSQVKSTECADDKFTPTMQGFCNGYSRCSGTAVVSILGDPCPGTYKYAHLDYHCAIPDSSSTQGPKEPEGTTEKTPLDE